MSDEPPAAAVPGGFVRVGRLEDFPPRRGRAVRVGRDVVAVFRVGSRVFALRDACPHMGASLADGRIDGDCVECHWHHWRFDLSSGQAAERSWARAERYEVRLVGGEVWLKPPAPPPAPQPAEDEDWSYWDASRYFKSSDDSQRAPDGEEGADHADRDPGEDH